MVVIVSREIVKWRMSGLFLRTQSRFPSYLCCLFSESTQPLLLPTQRRLEQLSSDHSGGGSRNVRNV